MTRKYKFPDGFLWGSSTASFQVEGNIKNNDWAVAAKKGIVPDAGSATDHYNLYKQDFKIAKDLGHNCHRFSIEWSRIEPKQGEFDKKEIEHYKNVLRELNKQGIKPFVTLWHFTLPEWFSEKGGFENKNAPEVFAKYVKFVVSELNEFCSFWTTMNEPLVWLSFGYQNGTWPPFQKNYFKLIRVYHNLVKAHKLAYKEIKLISLVNDVSIAKHNIYYSSDGKIWNNWLQKIVSHFWNHQFFKSIDKYFDSIGINYYFHHQFGKTLEFDQSDMGWDLDPNGLYHVLLEVKKYNKPVYVTESGIADKKDKFRGTYIKGLVYWTYIAIKEGINVKGFMYWSLLDNYEWLYGYESKFGLVKVNMKTKERTIRKSALEYKKICESNTLIIE